MTSTLTGSGKFDVILDPYAKRSDTSLTIAKYGLIHEKKTKTIKKPRYVIAYERYFGRIIQDQDKDWVPHFFRGSCKATLEAWSYGSGMSTW